MKIVCFVHSIESCWNHGNAHFVRGVLSELAARGHEVIAAEPAGSWSRANLLADHGEAGLNAWRASYPDLRAACHDTLEDCAALVAGADLVIVHEWNSPDLVAHLGALRRRNPFVLLFHDTHHRAVSAPDEMRAYRLEDYDGVLAFGEALAAVYRTWGWGRRVHVWHEAADTRRFRPPAVEGPRDGLVWIGNWGDGERTAELENFLLAPAAELAVPLTIHGVRYPADALAMLSRYNADYRGWLANVDVPSAFARHLATVHVPRRHYAQTLPGIPTIRMFEALACGIPLVSAPWDDCEGLFRTGTDYLRADSGEAMTRQLRAVLNDGDLRQSLASHGLETIRARHSCEIRADELLRVVADIGTPARSAA
jgi:spore maturation protein CgeB